MNYNFKDITEHFYIYSGINSSPRRSQSSLQGVLGDINMLHLGAT